MAAHDVAGPGPISGAAVAWRQRPRLAGARAAAALRAVSARAPTVAVAAWLLVPLAAGALLACWALLDRHPTGVAGDRLAATPTGLQLALIVLLAFAMPAQVVAWFRAVAAG